MTCSTQNERLLAYLKRRKYITRAPAFIELGIANRSKRSDGSDLEICYSHQLGKWLCFYCYQKGTAK
jgi:hypothetical protein